MRKKQLFEEVLEYFAGAMPEPVSELNYGNPFQLLVAVMLSAQCTDRRVNMVTPALFRDYPDAAALAAADEKTVYEYVRSVTYPNSKSKHLVEMARMLVERHEGNVPSSLDELVALPGVGRKTANVVQAVAWNKAAMAVDTHIYRVSHRLGLVTDRCTTPYSVERELTKYIPGEVIPKAHHWLLLHGRYTCLARSPKCSQCGLKDLCRYCKSN